MVMAFIRWKAAKSGHLRPCLVQSYRDAQGKPRHKILGYLGYKGVLTPELLAEMQEKHSGWKIKWDKIKPSPRPRTDISALSDSDLLKKMRKLRHERGWNLREMNNQLTSSGIVEFTVPEARVGQWINIKQVGALEKALERSEGYKYFVDPEQELAPALRQIFGI